MSRQNLLCANSKLNGCQGFVTQRGNILCENCTETRKNMAQNRREYEFDELVIRNRETEQELLQYKEQVKNIKENLSQLEKENSLLNEHISKLIDEKKRMEKDYGINEINRSQLALDNEKLIIDNKQLTILNESLTMQNEVLSKENSELSKNIESVLTDKKGTPEMGRARKNSAGSKIVERKKTT
jgi:predicted nuclease with TOPRIM domain